MTIEDRETREPTSDHAVAESPAVARGAMLFAAILLGAGALACGNAEAGGAAAAANGETPPTPVDARPAYRDTAIDEITATGQVEAVQSIELRPEASGRIVEILFREGAEMPAGTPLFKVDDAELRAQVARLEAQRDLAAQALERTRALLAENAASRAELEEAEARARSSQAELELTQVQLERTLVRAPFGGVAGERLVSLGDYVTPSTSLVTLQTVHPQRAAFEVPERYADRLGAGQSVSFRVAAVPDRVFSGTVDFVDPRVRLPARTIQVKAVVPNPDRALQSGMFIEARLAAEIRPEAVMIPEEAVLPLEEGDFVWVVTAEGTAQRRAVELGVRRPGEVEVRSGVEAGEQVVVGGLERLFDGAPVMVRQPAGDGPPPDAPPADGPADSVGSGDAGVGDADAGGADAEGP